MNPEANRLDSPALAARLSITTRHVRRLIQERRIPFIKVGRLVRFDPEAIERWLDENRSDRQTRAGSPPPPHRVRAATVATASPVRSDRAFTSTSRAAEARLVRSAAACPARIWRPSWPTSSIAGRRSWMGNGSVPVGYGSGMRRRARYVDPEGEGAKPDVRPAGRRRALRRDDHGGCAAGRLRRSGRREGHIPSVRRRLARIEDVRRLDSRGDRAPVAATRPPPTRTLGAASPEALAAAGVAA